ncbi:MAG: ChbG/HpnK family deacetylase [Rickettsiales bacterium]|jgi:predicted glycoside hydrolase/deacetylase ChbG (UPF0249 family)|nr:ChbG/HpnK family deacetylase [Rickettsiales bacterium]
MKSIIVNADDFGISRGTDKAVRRGFAGGIINSASIIANSPYVDDIKGLRGLKIKTGLHLNLVAGRALAPPGDIPLLADGNGMFRHGFIGLFAASLLHPAEFARQVAVEAEAQIAFLRRLGLKLSHLDSHRHAHMIPAVFGVARRMAEKYNIPRIRVVNESLWESLRGGWDFSFLFNGGIVKYAVLRFLGLLCGAKSGTYFYSILYTGRIFKEKVRSMRVPAKYGSVEICIHPNMAGADLDDGEVRDRNVLSASRAGEMAMAMDRHVLDSLKARP